MDNKIRIMLVEDDAALADEIALFLKKWGYETTIVKEFQDVLTAFITCRPQLVLMDINLPCYDGFYWCRRIREISEIPLIYISSRSDDNDKIMAVAQGGDDYVEKPFRLEILRTKMEAVLRRTYQYRVKDRIYLQEDVCFEQDTASLLLRGREVELTRSEKRIMAKLVEHRPDIITREDLMMTLWSTDEFVSDGTLTTLISRLRNKLLGLCGEEFIKTRKGQGYYIE
ncbi:MAG: response regulator transcription factor [Blautia sp.]|nr:response regulator transcription factor [Blautia sp.]MCM1201691.1 response regulator transcription factor [Bacteroides fragilis]